MRCIGKFYGMQTAFLGFAEIKETFRHDSFLYGQVHHKRPLGQKGYCAYASELGHTQRKKKDRELIYLVRVYLIARHQNSSSLSILEIILGYIYRYIFHFLQTLLSTSPSTLSFSPENCDRLLLVR